MVARWCSPWWQAPTRSSRRPARPRWSWPKRPRDGGVPTVLAEALPGDGVEEDRGAVISSAAGAAGTYSTVDDLDLTVGRVATVLALSDARDGIIGRYGLGSDVDGILPRWQGP